MNGILLVDKPSGWTSNDVVMKLRGMLRERRIGHSGTLDPMATGLLVVFVGRATRAVEFAEADSKSYSARLRLGLVTDTQDITGTVLEERQATVSRQELEAVLGNFRGELEQIPPMYSAIKINGRKLYDIARKGGEVERKPRRITVFALELTGRDGDDRLLDIKCSKGTYIRTLCHDIGAALGCGGCMSALRRTSAGAFNVADAYSIEDVQRAVDEGRAEELLLPVDSLFSKYESYTVDAAQERKIRTGASVKADAADGLYRVYSRDGEFLMLGRAENGILKTVKSFFEV